MAERSQSPDHPAIFGRQLMKRFVSFLAVVAITVLVSMPMFAQDSSSPAVLGTVQHGNTTIVFERSNAGLNLDQLSAFGQLASSEPALVRALAKNPSLVNSAGFVSKHPALQQFLEKYPNAAEDIVVNPGNYLTPVNGSSWSRAPKAMKD
jgi:hypothetical protein